MSGDPVAQRPASPVTGRSVLITGGSGAFGQAFVRRCLEDGARRIVVYSRSESKQAAMKVALPDERIRYVIGDVRDGYRVLTACRSVDIVVHAAALKRVEVCESDPDEAVATNIRGTQLVAHACVEAGVTRAVFLSTDKAAAPATLYGATKMTAERVWLRSNVYSAGTATKFSATRYGNVWGSTGSVVPLWKSQAASGVITVTDAHMSRFFMSMDGAVDLVMLALREMRGGETFVPVLKAAPIWQLAYVVAPGCALKPIGIRPGEKLHETLVTEDEARRTHDCGDYYVIEPEDRSWGSVAPLPFPKVSADFTYRSDTAMQLTDEELRELAA